jgi:hypothetical protein
MCGWLAASWLFFFHERQADAFSWAMPMRTHLAVAALFSRGVQQWLSDLLFVVLSAK